MAEVISGPASPGETRRLSATTAGGRLQSGSRVASYRIEEMLGRGGMAEVYRALDERLGRQVALKVLAPELAGDRNFRQRFIRESRAAAAVEHPNIIPIFEAGDSEGVLFIAMRLVRSGDVSTLVRRAGWLSPEQALDIASAVASALDAAHAAGLVHRDVKPGNMLIDMRPDSSSHVYLTDFGITALETAGNTGPIVGTFDYMAPEQIEGGPVDGRTDQYELACSVFEMLSGFPPFRGKADGAAKLWAQVHEAPPALTSLRPELPLGVDEVLAKAMSKPQAGRFATCAQFARALGAALKGPRTGDGAAAVAVRSLEIAVKPSFRYVHEPSRADEDAFISLGNDRIMRELESRIRHSRGGTFLITGFRGVGKSTLVLRALDDLVASSGPDDLVLPVTLSVARSTTTERLLFAVVRRVFETLSDSGALTRLAPQTQHALLVAYMRTSLSFKESQSEDRERSAGLDLGLGPGRLVKAVADFAAPKVSLSATNSHSLATEAAFLAYSETDVEYDLMRIVSLLDRPLEPERRQRFRRFLFRRRKLGSGHPPRLHLVIVLDEVDKLTAGETGLTPVEELLSGIKNVLTASGAHFLIVAGPDLHDRAIRDIARGNGVYESVFGWRLYVPCIWDAPDRLIADILAEGAAFPADTRELLVNYLRFKARGVPRRLLQEVNGFIGWAGDRPSLKIGPKDLDRVEFYAGLERILRDYIEGSGRRRRLFPVAIDEDRWRLGGYYIVDWVLQSEGEPFTPSDLIKEGDEAEFDPLLRISRRNVERLLDHLSGHGIVEVVREVNASATVYGDVAGADEKAYRLADEIRHYLYDLAARNEAERADLDISFSGPDAASFASVARPTRAVATRAVTRRPAANLWYAGEPEAADSESAWTELEESPLRTMRPRVIGNRYELGELISQGGISSSYKGRDLITGRQVIVKLLRTTLSDDPVALARFRREADVVRHISHPHIVRTLAILDTPAEGYALIQDWVSGPTLEARILDDGPMPPAEVVGLSRVLADALSYLADKQIIRLDLKPGNIIMADHGPVIADLGLATSQDFDTSVTVTGQFVGTPAFMAPEVINGREPDARTDIYALGLIMYYCLAGGLPWQDLPAMAVLAAVLHEQLDLADLPISAEFRDVLGTASARDPDQRFGDAKACREALDKTPEWREVIGGQPVSRLPATHVSRPE